MEKRDPKKDYTYDVFISYSQVGKYFSIRGRGGGGEGARRGVEGRGGGVEGEKGLG